MNDQHPHAGYVGDDAYATGSFTTSESGFDNGGHQIPAYDTGAYQTADPLYGGYDPGHGGPYDTAQWSDASTAYADQSGQWDAAAWTQPQDAQQYAATAATYDTTGQWYAPGTESYGAEAYGTEAYDAASFDTASYDTASYDTGAYEAGPYDTGAYDTGAYEATAWNHAPEEAAPAEGLASEEYDHSAVDDVLRAESEADLAPETETETGYYGADSDDDPRADDFASEADDLADGGPSTQTMEALDEAAVVAPVPTPRPTRRAGGNRNRRRTPNRRSALLTVAVPSACVMGVAGIAAASVSGLTGPEQDEGTAVTAADPALQPTVVNNAFDTQLDALDAEALDFGDRASRTQERIDLKARQEAERQRREAEAKRREAMRPKFALPVALRQLSAGYGQAGVNWMSLHTGIDFPVQYGTPVMAATDGTVRTQWNSAYGNMVIVTAADGTETWYCHLSTAKIRSGSVKAGEVIAYSGNSGNSTGPHLHFEVRPGGGTAIDPEAWLRRHGLNPTG
ncbi:peptidoglycan DD-metalloendopeptidase family protein [Streptomyces sp. Act-28]